MTSDPSRRRGLRSAGVGARIFDGTHHLRAELYDSGFFSGDFFDGMAEITLVIEGNRSDYSNFWHDDIRRVNLPHISQVENQLKLLTDTDFARRFDGKFQLRCGHDNFGSDFGRKVDSRDTANRAFLLRDDLD